MKFELEISKQENISFIDLKGNFECSLCKIFEIRLKNYIYKNNLYLIISLNGIDKISKLAVGYIYKIIKECDSMGGRANLIISEEKLFDYFKEPHFKIFKKKEEAVKNIENIMFR